MAAKRCKVYAIVTKDDDMFVAVANTKEGAEKFMKNSGAGQYHWRILEIETVDGAN